MKRKALLSAIEMPILLLIFASGIVYFGLVIEPGESYSSSVLGDSIVDVVVENNTFRSLIFDEDLSQVALTQDWSFFESFLNQSIGSYEVIVGNLSVTKTIYTCEELSSKYFSERFIYAKNESFQEMRFLRLGVCS
ncbi:MAG: hypothetical protein ACOCXG_01800 [Nanoarchaeota archaeon]